uniref:Uncharacterized protein n=1 Tax=Anguilla anguilla TaxID=7936 RepID=A0A0E9U355_ANGAN
MSLYRIVKTSNRVLSF